MLCTLTMGAKDIVGIATVLTLTLFGCAVSRGSIAESNSGDEASWSMPDADKTTATAQPGAEKKRKTARACSRVQPRAVKTRNHAGF